jgi:hypothetical protein
MGRVAAGRRVPAVLQSAEVRADAAWEAGVADDESVVFSAPVSGGTAADGLFRSDAAGNLTSLLVEGDAVATPGGGTFLGFGRSVSLTPSGHVAFDAEVLRAPTASPREAALVLADGALREITIRQDARSQARDRSVPSRASPDRRRRPQATQVWWPFPPPSSTRASC